MSQALGQPSPLDGAPWRSLTLREDAHAWRSCGGHAPAGAPSSRLLSYSTGARSRHSFGDIVVVPIGRRASRRRRSLFPRAIVRLACPARPLPTASNHATSPTATSALLLPLGSAAAIAMATERSPGGVDRAALRGERFRGWLRVGDQEVPSTSAVAVDQAAGMGVEAVLARPSRGPGDRVRVASENPLRCNVRSAAGCGCWQT